jgi:N-ethylmaleimide reductase
MTESTLFSPLRLPTFETSNRIFMAPMTRGRAHADGTPSDMMVDYYASRADAGLLITEGVCISPRARGWVGAPSIYTADHVRGWQAVTDAVHARGGRIFAQLWFLGRVSHPIFLDGELPWAPSAITPKQHVHSPTGETLDCVEPHAMTVEEIAATIAEYGVAARLAIDAGFDGVEIHAANGYLPDQFLRDRTNQRQDGYGGSVGNRIRFLREIVEECSKAIDGNRVAVRVSPRNLYNDIDDSDPETLFGTFADDMNRFGLAFIEVVEGLPGHYLFVDGAPVLPVMRSAYRGLIVANGGYTSDIAEQAIADGAADAVAFGTPFISNPDLVKRFEIDAPLNAADPSTFYSAGPHGYLDYPDLSQGTAEAEFKPLSLGEARKH